MTLQACPTRVPAFDGVPSSIDTEFIGESDVFRRTRQRLEQVARTDATVLLLGETGTGKGLAAHVIHDLSARRTARFVGVDCGSLPATLIESELFGRERGAFTDARTAQIGRFELANGGTIFLDEIGELSHEAQSKLLRVLQTGEFERLGSPQTIQVDVRVIAATNRVLEDEVRGGRFRRDLYYRLNVFPIVMPPLRERPDDIPALVHRFVHRFAQKHRKPIDVIPDPVLDYLAGYGWPGNVRELENVLERAIIVAPDATLRLPDPLPASFDTAPRAATTLLIEVEREHITRVLHASDWRIEGARGAAAALGLKPSTLRSRMRKLGIRRMPYPTGEGSRLSTA
jgi:transcriptional regulator with GAF, ATPase, and Fis domain